MAYGMSAAKEAGLAQTQVWKRLMGMPVDQLKAAAHGEVPGVDMNLATLALRAKMTQVADKGAQAQQQLAQAGQGSVKARMLAQADQLPEMLGIGRLPAQNMEEVAAAEGGIMSYADGGEVAHFADKGLVRRVPSWDDVLAAQNQWQDAQTPWYMPTPATDPAAGLQDRYKKMMAAYEGKTPMDMMAPLPKAAAPAAAPAAPAAPAVDNRIKAPEPVKNALNTVTQPKVPVENPSKAEVYNLDKTLASTEKLYDFLDKKFGDQMAPIKEQLQRDRDEYKNMKSENVGLALLGAAGALLKPGRTTASAIGEGLSTLGEYGMKFQPQMLAARQGISAGEIGLAQAQAQAARGNFGTAAQMVGQDQTRALQERELAAKEPLYKAQAHYYDARATDTGLGGGGSELKQLKALQSSLQAELKSLQGKVDPASQDRAKLLQQNLAQISQRLAGGAGLNLTDGFVGGRDVTGKAFKSSLFAE